MLDDLTDNSSLISPLLLVLLSSASLSGLSSLLLLLLNREVHSILEFQASCFSDWNSECHMVLPTGKVDIYKQAIWHQKFTRTLNSKNYCQKKFWLWTSKNSSQ